ncbi:MAG: hypothetical protein N0C89_16405 [Candidatus Thiodiazotropha endolucinida]|nr:hypothetical protein [Candidatus Thiodiazotropha taylori]MCG8094132.1 hypothetical protein [Candidatus Thiodiazotropha endolucinida]MCG8060433.1 hypothetical protein [Candidatus Thiodiazotropha taylori]MCG8065703.1 hypothetical protein [Candidatus Thiodiazotropha taylori]MCW4331797.1 hypothetical protein [Candidatus Thiodiazotropha endolucinida]
MTNRLTMLHGYAMGILILIGGLVLPQPADAVPAFARQTSMPCTACHFQHFPTLNSFGRSFRAGGYTLTGGQGMIEGDDISLPLMLNASVITKLRYVKSNGNTNVGSDYGVIEWPDEAALLVGGKLAKDAGFLMELGLTDANSFLSTKVHFNVGKAGGTQFSVIPFSTDGLGSAYGFELLNTGAQRSQRPIEDRTGFSAAQALGLGSGEATGIALVASSHNFFINYTPWVPGWEENNVEVKPSGLAHYLRAAYTPFIGSWDTGFGFQLWSGDAEVADGAGGETLIATDGWVVDGQMQGSVGSMPLGIYASFGSCSADESHFLEGCTNTDDGEAFGILAQLGILPNKANVFAAYRALDDGSDEDSEFNSTTVGINYLFSQNIRFELFYVKESGDGVDARDNDRDSKWLF